MAAVVYYVRKNQNVMEVAKEVRTTGGRKPRFTSDIWIHAGTKGYIAYYKERTHKMDMGKVFEGVSKVIGDTYEIRDLLKSLGFKWNPMEKAWVREIPQNEQDEIEERKEAKALAKEFIYQAGTSFEETINGHSIKYEATYIPIPTTYKGYLIIDNEKAEFDTNNEESMIRMGKLLKSLMSERGEAQ